MVRVDDFKNNYHQARVLLDNASQSNFITEALCDKLKLATTAIDMNVIGIGPGTLNITHKANVNFYSRCNNYKGTVTCLVVPHISSALPTYTFNQNEIEIPPNINLADPEFYQSRPVDLLWHLLVTTVGRTSEGQQVNFTKNKARMGDLRGINKQSMP